jgi:hypothetical protein
MVTDAEAKVRAALSRHLTTSSDLPRDVALSLARDVEEVSLPFLETSSVLNDADLIEIVRNAGVAKQLAVARRAHVSDELASAIVDHGRSGEVIARWPPIRRNSKNMADAGQAWAAFCHQLARYPLNLPGRFERLQNPVSKAFAGSWSRKRGLPTEWHDLVLQVRDVRPSASCLRAQKRGRIDFVGQLSDKWFLAFAHPARAPPATSRSSGRPVRAPGSRSWCAPSHP